MINPLCGRPRHRSIVIETLNFHVADEILERGSYSGLTILGAK
jgi:predicted metal-dependent TIM-barrel fold hydrolase